MDRLKILVLVGGIGSYSINKKLFGNVKELTSDKFEFDEVDIASLPYYSQDLEAEGLPVIADLKKRIEACDGVLFVTPEYNRNIPGVLKNAIDWGSRPYENNSWKGKTAAIIGATIGTMGTYAAQNHLRETLVELAVRAMPAPRLYYTASGDMNDGKVSEQTAERIKKMFSEFAAWVQKFKK